MVKIIDVARKAGVAPSTVSHVLNGKRPISKNTRERVLKIIHELGYEPNPNAQALKSKKTGIIGFIAHDITESFITKIIRGVEKQITKHKSYLAIVSGVEFNYDFNRAINFLQKRRIDGIIISFEITLKDPISNLADFNIPIVTINRKTDGNHFCVLPNNFEGGYQAALHLISVGVKQPAMIAASKNRFASEERKMGFIKALKENGININDQHIYYGDFSYESGIAGFDKLFRRNPNIDGFFCANDYIAAGALSAALEKGYKIPEDIKIIGYDDRDFSSFKPVPLTTFYQPLEKMGEISAEILLGLINGIKPKENNIYLNSKLIIRESTKKTS